MSENPLYSNLLVPTRGVVTTLYRAAIRDAARLKKHSNAARWNEIQHGVAL